MVRRMSTRARTGGFAIDGLQDLAQTYHLLPRVRGNRKALNCVFRNLLDNSMKYGSSERPTEVHIGATLGESTGVVVIRLQDNGIGIPADEQERVFEDGYRSRGVRATHPQGLGRGLYECRVLLKRMGGDIRLAESEQGTAFEIILVPTSSRS